MADPTTLPTQIEQSVTSLTRSHTAITDQESYETALASLSEVQMMRRQITTYFQELKAPVLQAQRRLNQASKDQLQRLEPIEQHLHAVITDYENSNIKLDAADADVLVNASLATGVPAAPLVPRVVTPAGHHRRTTVSVEVTDLLSLVKAIAAGQVPLAAVKPHAPFLNAMARSDGELFTLPGCERRTKTTIVT